MHTSPNASLDIARNPGKRYGGLLNVSHMGYYAADEQFLNISFKETTIIRRMNVRGIRVRAMCVVSISTMKKVKPNHCTFHHVVQQLWSSSTKKKNNEEALRNHSLPLRMNLCFTPVLFEWFLTLFLSLCEYFPLNLVLSCFAGNKSIQRII